MLLLYLRKFMYVLGTSFTAAQKFNGTAPLCDHIMATNRLTGSRDVRSREQRQPRSHWGHRQAPAHKLERFTSAWAFLAVKAQLDGHLSHDVPCRQDLQADQPPSACRPSHCFAVNLSAMHASGASSIPCLQQASSAGSRIAPQGEQCAARVVEASCARAHSASTGHTAPAVAPGSAADVSASSGLSDAQGTARDSVGTSRAAHGPSAGKAADSAAMFTHHSFTFRPSSLQYGFMNRSASLSLNARSHDLESGENSYMQVPGRCTPDASVCTPCSAPAA